MARKSRKSSRETAVVMKSPATLKYRAGIYVRLSVEDNGDKKKDSIQNQILFLQDYVKKTEEFQLVRTYVDNGTTGTNFDRENWNRLLDDIKKGEINCIIVKDFSRIGRNYIEVGNYLEKIFPFFGVRVISVNDGFDSSRQSYQNDMLINSLTNIVNEYYARDISRKVTQTKRTMQKNGECVSGVVPYGYRKSDADPKRLTVDPGCADIVKKIFEWRVCGKGCTRIADYLNELAIPSPGWYRYMNGQSAFKRCENVKWKSRHVAGILTNPVYLGHMVQGKTRSSYFEQDGRMRFLPKEEWIVVEHTQEPLVTQEQFAIAARMAENSRERYQKQRNMNAEVSHVENPLRKKIYCGQCGGLLTRRSRVKYKVRDYCYYCSAPSVRLHVSCSNTHIHEIPLMEAVEKATDQQLRLFGRLQSQYSVWKTDKNIREKECAEIENEIVFLRRKKQQLYIDMKEGLLSQDDFGREQKRLTENQRQYEEELRLILDGEQTEQDCMETVNKYRQNVLEMKGDHIPIKLLDDLIERIVVLSPERMEIRYTFSDLVQKWQREGIRDA